MPNKFKMFSHVCVQYTYANVPTCVCIRACRCMCVSTHMKTRTWYSQLFSTLCVLHMYFSWVYVGSSGHMNMHISIKARSWQWVSSLTIFHFIYWGAISQIEPIAYPQHLVSSARQLAPEILSLPPECGNNEWSPHLPSFLVLHATAFPACQGCFHLHSTRSGCPSCDQLMASDLNTVPSAGPAMFHIFFPDAHFCLQPPSHVA